MVSGNILLAAHGIPVPASISRRQVISSDGRTTTELLHSAREGDPDACDALCAAMFAELQQLARQQARKEAPGRIQTGSLVNEAYIRLVRGGRIDVADRRHFLRLAAKVMRDVCVDRAKGLRAQKRGGDRPPAPLPPEVAIEADESMDVASLDAALRELAETDELCAEIIQLRFFGGLTLDQVAGVLDVSPRHVDKKWAFARAWLHRRLSRS
jgi:RNA polymerase sigma factor (TIGR02999 family)